MAPGGVQARGVDDGYGFVGAARTFTGMQSDPGSSAALDFDLTWTSGDVPGPDAVWLPAVVPGGVHESLLAAGLLEHPYEGENEDAVGWVERATWWYRARFEGEAGAPAILHCAGLDGVAELSWNGTS
ncbi:glycosyl hydrolase 2 galactose-binding domain-containing protein, partial [Humibacter sp.]|uniref:glycosyl hydrolase 2 galactose-binding domain-containing protein n=1 Tax=Humibacter sp. TaxID=1940291 RepID=UPI002BB0A421|nr:hypothetical protein [Humibacter sp.]